MRGSEVPGPTLHTPSSCPGALLLLEIKVIILLTANKQIRLKWVETNFNHFENFFSPIYVKVYVFQSCNLFHLPLTSTSCLCTFEGRTRKELDLE